MWSWSVFGRRRSDQPSLRVDDCESLSSIDGLVLDLQMQSSFDQLAELAVLGRVIRINAEQELPIVRVEKGLSTQGGRMWPNSQATSQFIDVWPVKLPDVLIGDGQLTADDPG